MGWTKEKPTQDGWYWYREGASAPSLTSVEFTEYMDGTAEWRATFKGGACWSAYHLDGEWQGPITPES